MSSARIYVNSLKTKNPQIIRWLSQVAEFDYEIHHRKGEKMQHVDALSRAPVNDTMDALSSATIFNISVREDEILLYQRVDNNLERKIKIFEKAESARTKREKDEIKEYELRERILYKKDENGKLLYVVPRNMRKAIVIKNHDLTHHFGVDRTVARISENYYFSSLRKYVRRHIAACVECILAKTKTGKLEGELHPIPPVNRPFEIVHLDHLGPFVTSSKNNKYILAVICNLTKFVQLFAVRDVKAGTAVKKLELFVERFGAPMRFISDRGTAFTSSKFDEFCSLHHIKHTLNSSRHPQANGQVEKLNRTIIPALQCSLEDCEGKHWDQNLNKLKRDLNGSISKTTGKTPFEMLYGYLPRFNEGLTRELTSESETYRVPKEIQEEAIRKIEIEQSTHKERYDKSRCKNVVYEVGDIVFVKCNPISTGESTKLQARYKGSFVITVKLPSDTYRIHALGKKRSTKNETTAHVSQMKIWKGVNEDSDAEEAHHTSSDQGKILDEPSRLEKSVDDPGLRVTDTKILLSPDPEAQFRRSERIRNRLRK